MLTAAGRPMSVIETNDVIMAYEKHVAHNQKVLEREEAIEKALENIEVTEKGADSRPLYHVIESKEY